MNDAATIRVLNRLSRTLYYSFARYLTEATPWTAGEAEESGVATFRDIVYDQEHLLGRVVTLIRDLGGEPDSGGYPMEYTDTHFLSFAFLLKEAIRFQLRDLAILRELIDSLENRRDARDLAEEAWGAEQRHLHVLENLRDSTHSQGAGAHERVTVGSIGPG